MGRKIIRQRVKKEAGQMAKKGEGKAWTRAQYRQAEGEACVKKGDGEVRESAHGLLRWDEKSQGREARTGFMDFRGRKLEAKKMDDEAWKQGRTGRRKGVGTIDEEGRGKPLTQVARTGLMCYNVCGAKSPREP